MIGVGYLVIGLWFAVLSWDRKASDTQNFAAFSMAILIWPLIIVAGLILVVARHGK